MRPGGGGNEVCVRAIARVDSVGLPAAGVPPDWAAGGAAQATIFARVVGPALALISGTTKTLFTPPFETSIPFDA